MIIELFLVGFFESLIRNHFIWKNIKSIKIFFIFEVREVFQRNITIVHA